MSLLVESAARGKEFAFKHVIQDMPLKTLDNFSFEEGWKAEKVSNWELAASHYYSSFLNSPNAYERSLSGIQLSQILTNFSRYGQAREVLEEVGSKIDELSGNEGNFIKVKLFEKKAWVSGYLGFFDRELEELQLAENNLRLIGRDYWTQDRRDVESTIGHFRGRAYYAKAIMSTGKTREELLQTSLEYFTHEAERLKNWRSEGNAKPSNEAYQHAWISKSHLMMEGQENISMAEVEASIARKLFQENLIEEPGGGNLANSCMLEGAIEIKKGNSREARKLFMEALEIRRTSNSYYLRGVAEAYGGIAVSYFSEGKMGYYTIYASEAIKILAFGS